MLDYKQAAIKYRRACAKCFHAWAYGGRASSICCWLVGRAGRSTRYLKPVIPQIVFRNRFSKKKSELRFRSWHKAGTRHKRDFDVRLDRSAI